MKQVVNIGLRSVLFLFIVALSACSTMKDLGNVNVWPFGSKADAPRIYHPANSVAYTCEANKKFFVRMLDKGADAWLILPDREVSLPQVGTTKIYSNGISKLDLSAEDAVLVVSASVTFTGCKPEPLAK
jgi:hypothetical protein